MQQIHASRCERGIFIIVALAFFNGKVALAVSSEQHQVRRRVQLPRLMPENDDSIFPPVLVPEINMTNQSMPPKQMAETNNTTASGTGVPVREVVVLGSNGIARVVQKTNGGRPQQEPLESANAREQLLSGSSNNQNHSSFSSNTRATDQSLTHMVTLTRLVLVAIVASATVLYAFFTWSQFHKTFQNQRDNANPDPPQVMGELWLNRLSVVTEKAASYSRPKRVKSQCCPGLSLSAMEQGLSNVQLVCSTGKQ